MEKSREKNSEAVKPKESLWRLIRITFPLVKTIFMRKYPLLIGLLVFSLFLGIVPTIKSQLESNLVAFSDRIVRGKLSQNLDDLVKTPLIGQRWDDGRESSSLPERITNIIIRDMPVSAAILAYLLFTVAAALLEFGNRWIRAGIQKHLFGKLRLEAIGKKLKMNPSELPEAANVPGQYATAIHQGAMNVGETYGYLLDVGQYLFSLITTIYLLVTKSWIFAFGCISVILLQLFVSFLQAKSLQKNRTILDKKRNELWGRTDDILSKRDILVANEQDSYYAEKLDSFTLEYAETDRKLDVSEAKYSGMKDLVSDLGKFLILIAAVAIVVSFGNQAISGVEDIYFLVSIYTRLLVPAGNLISRYDSIKRSEATSDTYLQLLEIPAKAGPANGSEPATNHIEPGGDFEFSRVSFSYRKNDSRKILDDCSFIIPGGKTTLIVGPSGCGKSTIARLLLKFWTVSQGEITFGGRRLSDLDTTKLRGFISYVSQDDYIVEDTIRENLRWGNAGKTATEDTLLEILTDVGIANAGNRANLLSRHASQLSTGQKQRLSIARMLLDASQIAILDEPMAGVDIFTMSEMMPHFRSFIGKKPKTTIIISHRLSFLSLADNVVVVNDKGRIEEHGVIEELLKKPSAIGRLKAAALSELSTQRSS